jgi:hypothetical protein
MGRVYRATQMALGRQVALKVIVSELAFDEAFHARFERESPLLLVERLQPTVRGCAICVASRLWRPERDALNGVDQGLERMIAVPAAAEVHPRARTQEGRQRGGLVRRGPGQPLGRPCRTRHGKVSRDL